MRDLISKIEAGLDKIIFWFVGKINGGRTPLFKREADFSSVHQQVSRQNSPQVPFRKLWADDLSCPPINGLSLILTQKCNLKCDYCLRNTNSKQKLEIPFDGAEQIILAAHRMGCRNTGLTGGDFFLYSKWREIASLVSNLKWNCLIETNGILIVNHPDYLDYLAACFGKNLTVLVSLDSFQKEKHDRHRGKGSFDKAVEAIKIVKSRGVKSRVNALLTADNFMKERDLLAYIDFVKKLGVDIVGLGRVLSIGRGASQGFSLSPYEVNEFFRILKKHDFFNGYVHWSWFDDLDESRGCDRAGQLPCVSPLGIHPCIFHQDIKLGDLKDFEKIIWSNFFQSLDMMRRASRTGLPQVRFSCSECIRCLPDYLKQAKKMTLITY